MMTAEKMGRRVTKETAEMLMKEFPRRSGQFSDKVIDLHSNGTRFHQGKRGEAVCPSFV